MNVLTHYPSSENLFYYVATDHGIMCSFSRDFEDVWFITNLDDEERIEGPEGDIVEELILEAQASILLA